MNSNFIKIAQKYLTNKSKLKFIKVYERYFNSIKDKKLNILEIGIDKGESLRLWKEYFPNATICGIDIEKKNFIINGVNFLYGDQSDILFLKKITENYRFFDIIIDDGSHICSHIIKSFNFLYPFLQNKGLYIVEDLQTSYIPRYGGSRLKLNKFSTSMNFFKRLSDCVNYEHLNRPFYSKNKFDGLVEYVHFYQNIVFIKKGVSKKYYHSHKNNKSLLDTLMEILSKFFN